MTKDSQEIRKELTSLLEKRHELKESLSSLEQQIFNFETTYLDETSEYGNIFKGWNRYALAAPLNKNASLKLEKKARKAVKDTDRLFSSSSVSSPLSKRQGTAQSSNGSIPSTSRTPLPVSNSMGGSFDGPSSSNAYIKEEEDIYDDDIPRKKKRKE
ncbi:hypothetical protein PRIPAC_85319 [Pristionchus pacificus]|uniref:Chromatin modification-related protein MEAF6 n=1 Tax=Pristionchus pacificus TaxID=54126 RepID=A0A8R1Z763_PRIPA|nr:hypothetical protein PRIPAC_85319 [Pristionchus pacificus]